MKDDVVELHREAGAAFARNVPLNNKQSSSGKNDNDVGLHRDAEAAFTRNVPLNKKQGFPRKERRCGTAQGGLRCFRLECAIEQEAGFKEEEY